MNMNISLNNIKCQFQNHQQHQIMTVCLNKNCKSQRLCCLKCIGEFHATHVNDLVAINSFSSFILQESKNQVQSPQQFTYGNSQLIQGLEKLLNQIDGFSKIIKDEIQRLKKQNLQEYLNQQGDNQQGIQYWNKFIEGLLDYVEVKDCLLTQKSQNEHILNVAEEQYISKIVKTNDDQAKIVKQFILPFQQKQLKFLPNPQRLQNHQKRIYGIAISSDGTMIASGSPDETVKLWNSQTKQLMQTFQYNGEVYGGVAFSSNNQYLAYGGGGDHSIQVQDLKQNNLYATLMGHKGNISTIDFSQDSQLLYSGGLDNKLIVWNISEKAQIHSFDTDSYLRTIVNSPDNKLISCICEKSINIWDYSTKTKIIHQKDPHNLYGYGLCSSKDSSMFISSGSDGLIKIWMLSNSENNQKCLKETKVIKAADKIIYNVVLTPDEKYIVSIYNKETKVMIHEIESGNLIQELQYGDGKAQYFNGYVSISNDMNFLVCGGEDKMVKIWTRE